MWIELATGFTSFFLFILFALDTHTGSLEKKHLSRAFIGPITLAIVVFLSILLYNNLVAVVNLTVTELVDILLFTLGGVLIGYFVVSYIIVRRQRKSE